MVPTPPAGSTPPSDTVIQDTGPTDSAPPPHAWGLDGLGSNTTCFAPERPVEDTEVTLTRVLPELSTAAPVWLTWPPGDPLHPTLVEQRGRALRLTLSGDGSEAAEILDLTSRLNKGSEQGFLGLAYHPDFPTTNAVFLSYTTKQDGQPVSRVSRVSTSADGFTLDLDSEEVVLQLDQPYSNHNGGQIAFGPDGLLYLGLGDGGGGGDPDGNGQDAHSLLGAMLRLDIDSASPYGIPVDNPYADGVEGAPEIYATGLRNPWRWSFDRETGELWAGDVGQNQYEEIDIVGLGGNYGWNTMEAGHCYAASSCDEAGLILPVWEYPHDEGQGSVTGGYVYRGAALPGLEGTYLFADFYDGTILGLSGDPTTGETTARELVSDTGLLIGSFAEDSDGELYVLDYLGGIWRVDPAGSVDTGEAGSPFPEHLTETGCVDPLDPTKPAPGLIPYGVNSPLWSDGAIKDRWIALPEGGSLQVDLQGQLQLPVGAVVMKRFSLGDRPVETRLFVRHEDGAWAGYTWAWNEEGTEADLVRGRGAATFDGTKWSYPSRTDCLTCHTAAAGHLLGLHLSQLDGDFTYENGVIANQIRTWIHAGLLAERTPSPGALANPSDTEAELSNRARSYLHVNCAHCHRPGGTGLGSLDLRISASLAELGACDQPPVQGDLGLTDARVIAPGEPERSVLALRMHRTDTWRMPALGTEVVDPIGSEVVDAWIAALSGCE